MSAEEKHLYARYCYNCIIEFLYFIILYIETYGNASLYNLAKSIKFFKAEVSTFILIFEGKTAEDRLKQMLQTLDCFEFSDNEIIRITKANLKRTIYEDFILSKCVDLLLKGMGNISDICKSLNINNIIKIDKQNLLDVIEKYDFMHIDCDQKVILNHAHGLLGFQDHLYNSVTSYFHNILYYDKLLSFDGIKNHYNSILFCGLNNILGVLSILYSSNEFDCQNGYIFLKKKPKKHTHKKPLHMEVVEAKFLSRSLPIGQVVYSSQGSFLHQWTGEIGSLAKDCGVIYCVVNFTNGYQGVFNIYFNKSTLKVISEIDNLKKYIGVRDIVEFDAEYYNGKKLDRCWKAKRVKLLSSKKFQYDELLMDKLCLDSELQRSKCSNSMCGSEMVISTNYKAGGFSFVKYSKYLEGDLKIQESKCHKSELKVKDHKSVSNDLDIKIEPNFCDSMKNASLNEERSISSLFSSFTNTVIPDYLFMYANIHMLMVDKGVAVAKHGDEFYNILFFKGSVYPPTKSEQFLLKGQKVIVLIPYLNNIEKFSVAVLVYGLGEDDMNKIDASGISAKEFTITTIFPLLKNEIDAEICEHSHFTNGFKFEQVKYEMQLIELNDFITRNYDVSLSTDNFQMLLHSLCKANLNGTKFYNQFCDLIIDLSEYLSKYSKERNKLKNRRKLKRMILNLESDAQHNVNFKDLCVNVFENSFKEDILSNSNLNVESKSLDAIHNSNVESKSLDAVHGSSIESKPLDAINSSNVESKSLDAIYSSNVEYKSLDVIHNLHVAKSKSLDATCNINVESKSLDAKYISSNSLNSYNTSSSSTESFYSCESRCNTPEHSTKSLISNDSSADCPVSQKLIFTTDSVLKISQTTPLPTVLITDECDIVTNVDKEFKTKAQKNKKYLKSKNRRYLSLHSVPTFKSTFKKKKKKMVLPFMLKQFCKKCFESKITVIGSLCMISNSFFFFAVNIHSFDTVLPLPKKDLPKSFVGEINLKSMCEITIKPYVPFHLSQIITLKLL